MPYTYKKVGDKYAVYKKDSGKLVGKTKGTKEALKKYLAALHIHSNEGIDPTIKFESMIKLASLVKLKEGKDSLEGMSTEQKKAFLEAVYRFAEGANEIYRQHSLRETSKYLGELIEAAHQLTLSETEDWFDNVTVGRHMKHLGEAHKIFEKTASEIETLQQRLEAAYEDIGSTLNKYYDIGGMMNEASAVAGAGSDYQKFFTKAMKKFKIQEPGDLESDKQKKKFFNYIDKNYNSSTEAGKDGDVKKKTSKEEPKEEE
jgi:hypothetical protein